MAETGRGAGGGWATGTRWSPSPALVRALVAFVVVAAPAAALGRPDLLVLAAPFGLHAGLGLAQAPRRRVQIRTRLGQRWLREGQVTALHVELTGEPGAGPAAEPTLEQATVVLAPSEFVVPAPAGGAVSSSRTGAGLHLAVSPRRWGARSVGSVQVVVSTGWAGWRWAPQPVPGPTLVALPESGVAGAGAAPEPVGLVGQHRSRRPGEGTELWSIRPFRAGDRLRRVYWRTTLRTGVVHAIGTNAEEDGSVLLLLDAVVDVGISEGVDGTSSNLDRAVRAADAIAAAHLRIGDRVALRVLGRSRLVLPPGTGTRHLRRLQELLTAVRPGWPEQPLSGRLRLPVPAGTVVVALSPLLTEETVALLVTLARRRLTVVVVDTLPPQVVQTAADGTRSTEELAWRLRLLERAGQVDALEAAGVPVVPWQGAGTLAEVLRRLNRRPTSGPGTNR